MGCADRRSDWHLSLDRTWRWRRFASGLAVFPGHCYWLHHFGREHDGAYACAHGPRRDGLGIWPDHGHADAGGRSRRRDSYGYSSEPWLLEWRGLWPCCMENRQSSSSACSCCRCGVEADSAAACSHREGLQRRDLSAARSHYLPGRCRHHRSCRIVSRARRVCWRNAAWQLGLCSQDGCSDSSHSRCLCRFIFCDDWHADRSADLACQLGPASGARGVDP